MTGEVKREPLPPYLVKREFMTWCQEGPIPLSASLFDICCEQELTYDKVKNSPDLGTVKLEHFGVQRGWLTLQALFGACCGGMTWRGRPSLRRST